MVIKDSQKLIDKLQKKMAKAIKEFDKALKDGGYTEEMFYNADNDQHWDYAGYQRGIADGIDEAIREIIKVERKRIL